VSPKASRKPRPIDGGAERLLPRERLGDSFADGLGGVLDGRFPQANARGLVQEVSALAEAVGDGPTKGGELFDGGSEGLGGEVESAVERARALAARAAVEVSAGEGD